MSDTRIKPILMPKWGLSMSEGKITGWLKKAGEPVKVGEEILEVETDKIAGVVEASDAGVLRRTCGETDIVYPVKALIGIIADPDVPDAEIESYIANYVVPAGEGDEGAGAGQAYEFLETETGKIRYARRGAGRDVMILVHGFGGDLDNWLFNIDALAEKATVYALDLPGHGQSTKKIADASIEALAGELLRFMDKLQIDRAHLIGHSMGGAIALAAAFSAPQRINALTLIASAGLGPEINANYITGFINASSRKELKPVIEQLFADPNLVNRQLIDDLLKYKRIDGVTTALQQIASNLLDGAQQRRVLSADIENLDQPVLVIWGERDQIIPATHAKALQGKSIKTEIITDAGHMVQMECASRVNELILAQLGAEALA